MALDSMRQFLDHAAKLGYGVPALNLSNPEQVQAVKRAASERASPVIMQALADVRKYAGEPFFRQLIVAVKPVCEARVEASSTAQEIKPIPLESMARRHSGGEYMAKAA